MSNLIPISDKGLVSAKELYLGLGLDKSHWSRWYPTNIEENEFFKENVTWTRVRHNGEGNETMDFAISIEFAKHIAMMARTEKSHEYRNYFIKCEDKLKNLDPYKNLSPELKAIFQIDKKQQEFEGRLEKLENNMTIDYAQQEKLQRTGRIKIVEALGGKDAPAYKRLNKKAFSLFWNDYKRYMGVNSYKNTAVKDLVKANDFIDKWKPTEELELMIVGANAQMRM